MSNRADLNDLFEKILGSTNVYFQPPSTIKLKYPCILYSLDNIDVQYGDNRAYQKANRYQVTLMDKNPDSPYRERIMDIPMCTYQRHFASDNLNHDVFNLYF